jgi:superfamily II DNA or RNA helicase
MQDLDGPASPSWRDKRERIARLDTDSPVTRKSIWAYRQSPRRWQTEALNRWAASERGIVRVVTGAGKTALAEMCIELFVRRHGECRVVIVVPTQALLDQWFVSLREDMNVTESDLSVFSAEKQSSEVGPINLIVLNSARRWPWRDQVASDSLLVVDEVHRAGSPENQRILAADWGGTLGLSATPEREHDSSFDNALVPALGPIIYEYGYPEALADAVIVPFDLTNVKIRLLENERDTYNGLTRKLTQVMRSKLGQEAKETIATQLLQRRSAVAAKALMRIPVAVALTERESRGQTLVFHEFIEAAEKIAALLGSRGMRVATYHSQLSGGLRRDNLRLFRRGLFDVLVTCRALDEGANVPEATTAIIASATRSARQRIQRLGRVLRPARDKTAASVFTLYATRAEREQLEREESALLGVSVVSWRTAQVP